MADCGRDERNALLEPFMPAEILVCGAAGSAQATATRLFAAYNCVATAEANQGVRLPSAAPGMEIIVENCSGQPITIYGNRSDTIDDVDAVHQVPYSLVLFTRYAAGRWYSSGLATGFGQPSQVALDEKACEADPDGPLVPLPVRPEPRRVPPPFSFSAYRQITG